MVLLLILMLHGGLGLLLGAPLPRMVTTVDLQQPLATSVMESTRLLVSTDSAGVENGDLFDDKSIVPNVNTSVITKIFLGHTNFLHSIRVKQLL